MFVDSKKLKQSLTKDQIIKILQHLGADEFEESTDYLIFPTICHNAIGNIMSMKLYYYYNSKMFYCYTECNHAFDIFELIKKVFILKNINYEFFEIVQTIVNILQLDTTNLVVSKNQYKPIRDRYRKKQRSTELPIYDSNVLESLSKYYPSEWLSENITRATMDEYNILYSIPKNKIVIPHYNINGELIGIRGRALNQYEVEMGNKYMPLQIENILYSHPLSFNLYGLSHNKENIKNTGMAIIWEGEKSVLKLNSATQNNSVACCGSSISKAQIDLLIKNCSPREIVIAFDKEYEKNSTTQSKQYLDKLYTLANKYNHYCNISIIFDIDNLLGYKDSPIDRGYDIFAYLMKNRIQI